MNCFQGNKAALIPQKATGSTVRLTGKLARLPDGQLVKIEEVHSDGYATVCRVEGERKGKIALSAVSKLQPQ
jgi:hypothetical protein